MLKTENIFLIARAEVAQPEWMRFAEEADWLFNQNLYRDALAVYEDGLQGALSDTCDTGGFELFVTGRQAACRPATPRARPSGRAAENGLDSRGCHRNCRCGGSIVATGNCAADTRAPYGSRPGRCQRGLPTDLYFKSHSILFHPLRPLARPRQCPLQSPRHSPRQSTFSN